MLDILERLPEGLLTVELRRVQEVLAGPTLIHLQARNSRPLFVSVLIHGNEPAGLEAVQELLSAYDVGGGDKSLPRSLSLFFGNVPACAEGVRYLDSQPDFNRVWPGAETSGTPEHALMAQVVAEMKALEPFASIDVHNTSGLNPQYGSVNHVDPRFLYLASLFSRTIVYFTQPKGVQSMAFADFCPAVTLECGKPGQHMAVDRVRDHLETCLHLEEIPSDPLLPSDLDLFHTIATVEIPGDVSFGFNDAKVDLKLIGDLDLRNFCELPAGTSFGSVSPGGRLPVEVTDGDGKDLTDHYFTIKEDQLRTRVPVLPSMLTMNGEVIRKDCLCYFMERYDSVGE